MRHATTILNFTALAAGGAGLIAMGMMLIGVPVCAESVGIAIGGGMWAAAVIE